jgi:site-specific DNA recombinase
MSLVRGPHFPRIAIYARFSSDMQRDASIEDQVRVCTTLVERLGGRVVEVFSDYGISGATHLRPGVQRMLEAARNGSVDMVVAEALDRLSRDQEHVAGFYKQLSFLGVQIVTVAEGEINELHVGLKGTMNALFLKDLGQKTRRGLEGRVRQGKAAGGKAYGYEVVREFDSRGEAVRGGRRILESEARVVTRIFTDFAAGHSPRSIAKALNTEGISGPDGGCGRTPRCAGTMAGARGFCAIASISER